MIFIGWLHASLTMFIPNGTPMESATGLHLDLMTWTNGTGTSSRNDASKLAIPLATMIPHDMISSMSSTGTSFQSIPMKNLPVVSTASSSLSRPMRMASPPKMSMFQSGKT